MTANRQSPTPGYPLADLIYYARRYPITSEFRDISAKISTEMDNLQTNASLLADAQWKETTRGDIAKLRSDGLALQATVDVPEEMKNVDEHVVAAGKEMVQSSDDLSSSIQTPDATVRQRGRDHLTAAEGELQKANVEMKSIGLQYGVVSFASPTPLPPRATTTSTPTPTAIQPSAASKTVGIGQPASSGGVRLTVNAVRTVSSIDYEPIPSNGLVYVVIDVTIDDGSRSLYHYNSLNFTVKDTAGYEFRSVGYTSLLGSINFGILRPGEKVRGPVAFEIPRGTKQVTVILEPSSSLSDLDTLEVTVPVN